MIFQAKLALRYLQGRKLRTFLTTLAVIFGVMLIFSMNGLLPGLIDSFRQSMMSAADKVDVTITSAARGAFPAEAVTTVAHTPGISVAAGVIQRNVIMPASQALKETAGAPVNTLALTGMDPIEGPKVVPVRILKGRFLEPGDTRAVLVADNLAETTGLEAGGSLVLPSTDGTRAYQIVGIFASRSLPGTYDVYMPLSEAQSLLNLPGEITTIEALYQAGAKGDQVRAELEARLGPNFKLGEAEAGTELMAAVQMGETALNLIGLMALAMGGFIIFNTFRTVVVERRRDIGMLRAVGASRRTIIGIFLVESLIQGGIGTAVGMVGGYLLANLLVVAIEPVYQQFIRFTIGRPEFSPQTFLISILLGVGITVLSALIPARAASRVVPLEALRPALLAPGERVVRRKTWAGLAVIVLAVTGLLSGKLSLASLGALLFLLGLILVAPALVGPISRIFGRLLRLIFAREGQIAEGNMSRQPDRSAITATAMMIGLAIVVAMGGLVTSVGNAFMGYLDQSLGADYLLIPQSLVLSAGNIGANTSLAERLRGLSGVGGVTTLRQATTQSNGVDLQVVAIDPATYPKVSGLTFKSGDPQKTFAEMENGRNVIINGVYATQSRLKVGDALPLQTPGGVQPYRVVGIANDYINVKLATAFISQANLAQDFHDTTDVLLMINRAPGADAQGVEAELREAVKPYTSFTLYSSAAWRDAQGQAFNSAMMLLYILMIVLVIPSLIALINTLAINVLERTREIGMLRAVGATRRQVGRMILAESLLLSAAGTGFGILTGLWLGYVFVGALNEVGFVMSYFFPYAGLALTVALGMIFGVVAALLPARQAARLHIVEALHYE